MIFATIHVKAFKNTFRNEEPMTKEQMENIIQENMQKIYLYCVKRLENTAVAEDVASDIILELLRSYDRIASDEAIYGYIWSVANNLCKNYWRRREKENYAETFSNILENICSDDSPTVICNVLFSQLINIRQNFDDATLAVIKIN